MVRDINIRNGQLTKKIQSGGFLCKTSGNLMDNLRNKSTN